MLFSRTKRAKKCNNKKITQKNVTVELVSGCISTEALCGVKKGCKTISTCHLYQLIKALKQTIAIGQNMNISADMTGFMHMQCELLTGHHHFLILPSECVHFERHCILCLCLPEGHISRHNKLLIPVKSGFHISVIRKILAYQILAKIQYRASLLSSNPVVRLAGVTV